MSGSEKKKTTKQTEQEHTRKFLEVSRRSRAKQRHRNVQKVCCTCGVAFSLIRPRVVFLPFSLLLPPIITRFFILFEQTINNNYRELRFEPWLNLYITRGTFRLVQTRKICLTLLECARLFFVVVVVVFIFYKLYRFKIDFAVDKVANKRDPSLKQQLACGHNL